MRTIPTALAARIESGAAPICHAWILTRADGERMGFTDHDRELVVDGVTCSAASGWTAGAAECGRGVGLASTEGALDDERINEADIRAGAYDGARIESWRVDWTQPDLRLRIGVGAVARIERRGDRFVAEIEGPLAALDRVVGRTYGRLCDARLGDARCGVEAEPGATCDKRWATCVGVFDNGARFRGFPDIPGDDFLLAVPVEGGRNDGGSRR